MTITTEFQCIYDEDVAVCDHMACASERENHPHFGPLVVEDPVGTAILEGRNGQ